MKKRYGKLVFGVIISVVIIILIVMLILKKNINSEVLSEDELKSIASAKISEYCNNMPTPTVETPTCPDCRENLFNSINKEGEDYLISGKIRFAYGGRNDQPGYANFTIKIDSKGIVLSSEIEEAICVY